MTFVDFRLHNEKEVEIVLTGCNLYKCTDFQNFFFLQMATSQNHSKLYYCANSKCMSLFMFLLTMLFIYPLKTIEL